MGLQGANKRIPGKAHSRLHAATGSQANYMQSEVPATPFRRISELPQARLFAAYIPHSSDVLRVIFSAQTRITLPFATMLPLPE